MKTWADFNQCCRSALVSMRIRDLDPALFYLNVDPDTDPDLGSKTNADPSGSGSRLLSHKQLNFYMKNTSSRLKQVKKHTYEGTEGFLKGRKPGLFVNFGQ
jgi:hypothetical protein